MASTLRGSENLFMNNKLYTQDMYEKVLYGFVDYLTPFMPRTQSEMFKWAEYLWNTNGTYKMAMSRTSRYFITDVEIKGDLSPKQKKNYKEFLNDTLNIKQVLGLIGDDFLCYGNEFISVYKPFSRHLKCPKCGKSVSLKHIRHEFKNFSFYSECISSNCKYKGEFDVEDNPDIGESGIKIKRWNIHNIRLATCLISDKSEIYMEIPEVIKSSLTEGNPAALANTPMEFIEALKAGEDNKESSTLFKFSSDEILHLKEESICGVQNMGWGIPRVFSSMNDLFYVQILRKFNQALALDYIVPLRIVTPSASANQDPLITASANNIVANMATMIKEHQKNPTKWNILPFPVDYKVMSGEGLQANTKPLIEQAMATQMNSIGIPMELYTGNLQFTAAPTALRLYEQTWNHLTFAYIKAVNWVIEKVGAFLGWEEEASVQLTKVTLADSLEKKQILLSLMSARQVSQDTAFKPFGLDAEEETRKVLDEEERSKELMEEAERRASQKTYLEEVVSAQQEAEAQAQLQGGPPAPGGSPTPIGSLPSMRPGEGGMAGAGSIAPDQLISEANQIAQTLVFYTQPGMVRGELQKIKEVNETLYALVKSEMQKIRSEARSQGGAMMIEQVKSQTGA